MNKLYVVLALFLFSLTGQAESTALLMEDDWSRPRSATVVKSFAAVQTTLQIWLKDTQAQRIELRYPGGEEGSLWAQELSDWLVALGVPSNKLEVYPGHPVEGEMALVVLP